jgi:hypothetical protein
LQVYLPAIEGYVPAEMVKAIRAFLEFCYIARRDIHDTHSLAALDDALRRFHLHRDIFRTSGIRVNGFNLPRQHSLTHYVKLIRAFGAPNGLCSSITESKHIKAVKDIRKKKRICSFITVYFVLVVLSVYPVAHSAHGRN